MSRAAAIFFAALAAAYLAARPAPSPGRLPDDARGLASRLTRHPADWIAASALTEKALDAPVPNRVALWHASYELALSLAPARPEPRAAFARAAFFHWSELSDAQRKEALDTLAPLLRDSDMFGRMVGPIYALTADLDYLRRTAPRTAQASAALASLAATYGRFDHYRVLRVELQRQRAAEFAAAMRTATAAEVIAALPSPPYHDDARPIVEAALARLHLRPLDTNPARRDEVDALVDYALRHGLAPLAGIEPIVHIEGAASDTIRARLARKAGLDDLARRIEASIRAPRNPGGWAGGCGDERDQVCFGATRDVDAPHAVALTMTPSATDDRAPYVEIYVDDALRAEGPVVGETTLTAPVDAPGMHRVEVRLANPVTRNSTARRVRIVRLQSL